MSFIDKAKRAVGKAVDSHGEKIQQGLNKAGDAVDRKTGGKYTKQIRSGTSAAGRALDGLDGKQDDLRPPAQPRPAPTDSPAADPNFGPNVGPQ